MPSRRTSLFVGTIAATFCIAGASNAATHTVNQVGTSFVPADIIVQPGDTIEWVWANGIHTVTSGSPCTPDGRFSTPLDMGNPSVIFNVPSNEPDGTIPYFCIPHCGIDMIGTITVQGVNVPAASEWGLIAMALTLLTVATIVLVRRSKPAA